MPLAHTASGFSVEPHRHHRRQQHHHHLYPSSSSVPNSPPCGGSSFQFSARNPSSPSLFSYQQQQILQQQPFQPTTAYSSISDALLLALRQRPTLRLFRALFQYIPIRDSPNENPQLELPIQMEAF
ncbi:unnamed protein product [Gongylonema pulchrum]|uniref:Uncharacterized protein n=1 Tax=Gongylonema pulchrum TaxID=637853 RepID=A0A183DAF0_9BILA|nr:unnamed protein product [Gongylonema pulchrum]